MLMQEEYTDGMRKGNVNINGGSSGGAYFLGFVGALVYYIQQADGLWMGVLAILKAVVWPGYLVYHLFKSLGI